MGKPLPPRGPAQPPESTPSPRPTPTPDPSPPPPSSSATPPPVRPPSLTPVPGIMSTPSPAPTLDTDADSWAVLEFTHKVNIHVVEGREQELVFVRMLLPDGDAWNFCVCDCIRMYSEALQDHDIARHGTVRPFSRKRVQAREYRPPRLSTIRDGQFIGCTLMSCPYEKTENGKTFYGCEFSVFAEQLPHEYRQEVYSYALSGRITTHMPPEMLRLWFWILAQHDATIENRVAIGFISEQDQIADVNELLQQLVGHTAHNRKSFPDVFAKYPRAIRVVGTVSYLLNKWFDGYRKEERRRLEQPVAAADAGAAEAPNRQRGWWKPVLLDVDDEDTDEDGGRPATPPAVYEPFTIDDGHPPLPDSPAFRIFDPRKCNTSDWDRFARDVNHSFKAHHRAYLANAKNAVGRFGSLDEMYGALGHAVQCTLDEYFGADKAPRVALHSNLFFLSRAPSEPPIKSLESGRLADCTPEEADNRLAQSRKDDEAARARVDRLKRELLAAEEHAQVCAAEVINAEHLVDSIGKALES